MTQFWKPLAAIRSKSVRLDRLDLAVFLATVILLSALGLTIGIGDRAGVGIIEIGPEITAHTTNAAHVIFNEAMDTASVESAFVVDPPVAGKFSWNAFQLVFKPTVAWSSNTDYTITIHAGARSLRGRRLTGDLRWTFHTLAARVVYLYPAVNEGKSEPSDLYVVDPPNPVNTLTPERLTDTHFGVDTFAVSPDGSQIAYSERGEDGTADLYLLTLSTKSIQRLTNCVGARCEAPDWHPDGTRIAYQRSELNRDKSISNQPEPRTWILSVKDLSTAPLFQEQQMLGGTPRWSPDGKQIAIGDFNAGGIAIYDFAKDSRSIITTQAADTGGYLFNPDGKFLAFPQLFGIPQGFASEMQLADLTKGTLATLVTPDTVVEDLHAAWNPADDTLTLTRRYLDDPETSSAQIYTIDPASASTAKPTPLLVDTNYTHSVIAWNPEGTQLVIQRLPLVPEPGKPAMPSIWIYDKTSKKVWQIASNGYLPQWLP